MTNRERQIVERVKKVIIQRFGPQRIFLFGSRAKGNNLKNSDFDFAVEGEKPSLTQYREFEEVLDKIGGLYKIDVVFTESVEPGFKKLIYQTGKAIYEKRR